MTMTGATARQHIGRVDIDKVWTDVPPPPKS